MKPFFGFLGGVAALLFAALLAGAVGYFLDNAWLGTATAGFVVGLPLLAYSFRPAQLRDAPLLLHLALVAAASAVGLFFGGVVSVVAFGLLSEPFGPAATFTMLALSALAYPVLAMLAVRGANRQSGAPLRPGTARGAGTAAAGAAATAWANDDFDATTRESDSPADRFNPLTGLQMIGGHSGRDLDGNVWGTDAGPSNTPDFDSGTSSGFDHSGGFDAPSDFDNSSDPFDPPR